MDSKRKKQLLHFIQSYQLPESCLSKLDTALTHKSYANEQVAATKSPLLNQYNERLEFLGDAILGMIIVKTLYLRFPQLTEGDLTRRKSQLICTPTLAKIGRSIGLMDLLLIGKGENLTSGREKDSNIENALEAVIAAIYLSVGYDVSESFIINLWEPYISQKEILVDTISYKSILQEYLMKRDIFLPEYRVLHVVGREHEKEYTIGLFINHEKYSIGKGNNKKKAEQVAAMNFLKKNNITI